MKKVKIFILEDHHIVRQGLRSLVSANSDFEIVGEEGSPNVFLDLLPKIDCHLLILDLSLPQMSGLEVLEKVRKERPDIHVIILTMHDNPEYMIRALKLGAGAFLTKDTVADILIHAINQVVATGVYYPEKIDLKTAKASTPAFQSSDVTDSYSLTPKEKDVLKMMIKGMSSKKIAGEFGLSSRTIEAHRLNIMKKLGASNVAETIAIAVKLKLV